MHPSIALRSERFTLERQEVQVDTQCGPVTGHFFTQFSKVKNIAKKFLKTIDSLSIYINVVIAVSFLRLGNREQKERVARMTNVVRVWVASIVIALITINPTAIVALDPSNVQSAVQLQTFAWPLFNTAGFDLKRFELGMLTPRKTN